MAHCLFPYNEPISFCPPCYRSPICIQQKKLIVAKCIAKHISTDLATTVLLFIHSHSVGHDINETIKYFHTFIMFTTNQNFYINMIFLFIYAFYVTAIIFHYVLKCVSLLCLHFLCIILINTYFANSVDLNKKGLALFLLSGSASFIWWFYNISFWSLCIVTPENIWA